MPNDTDNVTSLVCDATFKKDAKLSAQESPAHVHTLNNEHYPITLLFLLANLTSRLQHIRMCIYYHATTNAIPQPTIHTRSSVITRSASTRTCSILTRGERNNLKNQIYIAASTNASTLFLHAGHNSRNEFTTVIPTLHDMRSMRTLTCSASRNHAPCVISKRSRDAPQ